MGSTWYTGARSLTRAQRSQRGEGHRRGARYFILEAYLGGGIGSREKGKPWKVIQSLEFEGN